MRDIQIALDRWGGWASSDNCGVDYSHIAAGFKGLIASDRSERQSCSDHDGRVIDQAITKLKAVRKDEELDLIVAHYMYGVSKRAIARKWKLSEGRIRQMLQVAEGFVDGYLYATGAVLDMDLEIEKSRVINCSKKVLMRYANSVLL